MYNSIFQEILICLKKRENPDDKPINQAPNARGVPGKFKVDEEKSEVAYDGTSLSVARISTGIALRVHAMRRLIDESSYALYSFSDPTSPGRRLSLRQQIHHGRSAPRDDAESPHEHDRPVDGFFFRAELGVENLQVTRRREDH